MIPLVARVTGLKIENDWRGGARGTVRCTARLSRRLRLEEAERIGRLENTSVERAEVVHECGPDEVEEWHTKLVEVLGGTPAGATRRLAVGERRWRRQKSPNTPRKRPDPAA
ncbi:MAG TPA: hypothetical protein VKS03_07980 [Thermoanaerobaculia bacterium]|nr:hypothetical protein [Thermoanaerobaculia bacterium]